MRDLGASPRLANGWSQQPGRRWANVNRLTVGCLTPDALVQQFASGVTRTGSRAAMGTPPCSHGGDPRRSRLSGGLARGRVAWRDTGRWGASRRLEACRVAVGAAAGIVQPGWQRIPRLRRRVRFTAARLVRMPRLRIHDRPGPWRPPGRSAGCSAPRPARRPGRGPAQQRHRPLLLLVEAGHRQAVDDRERVGEPVRGHQRVSGDLVVPRAARFTAAVVVVRADRHLQRRGHRPADLADRSDQLGDRVLRRDRVVQHPWSPTPAGTAR